MQKFALFVLCLGITGCGMSDNHDRRLPDVYPVQTLRGHEVTRAWPRVDDGQQTDHPHHQSIWIAHGDVNGNDFWHDPKCWVNTRGDWIGRDGRIVCTTRRNYEDSSVGDVRVVNCEVVMIASHGDLRFGDTKEGTFAMRLHEGLVDDLGGELQNAEGLRGADVWGKPSRWVQANGEVDGAQVTVVMAGHQDNLRHPTTWHARTYGLLAANPFGLQAFGQDDSGEYVLPAGEFMRLRYRVLLFDRVPDAAEIESLLEGFSSATPR